MYRVYVSIILTLFFFIVAADITCAKDLGKVGQTYPIEEIDMLEFIYFRLNQMQKSGELAKKAKDVLKTILTRSERFLSPDSYSNTNKPRSWLIGLSMTLKSDITDARGNVIVKSGTKVNPLTHTPLRSILLFYDGDVKDQVNWAVRQNKLFQGNTKLILVNGSISKQIQLFKKRIYFDQYGRLANKLQIKHVPAIARQEGLKIRVQEVLP